MPFAPKAAFRATTKAATALRKGRVPYIGASIARVEDQRFLTGTGRYSDDVSVAGQTYCVFVRSPHAHARIRNIDSVAAIRLPGVFAVLTGTDYRADGLAPLDHVANPLDALDIKRRAFIAEPGATIHEIPHWPLAIDRVRHVGDPVVAVIATTFALARIIAGDSEKTTQVIPLTTPVKTTGLMILKHR